MIGTAAAVLVAIVAAAAAAAAVVLTRTSGSGSGTGSTGGDGDPVVPVIDLAAARLSAVRSVLLSRADELSPPSLAALDDPASPQGRALDWVANIDTRRVDPHDESPSLAQRYALATLFFATGGRESWAVDCHFLSVGHECEWNEPGVADVHTYLGNYPPVVGARCGLEDDATVREIILPNNNLTGALPEELVLLGGLFDLFLPWNRLRGPIPPSLVLGMPHLEELVLAENSLSGGLPEVPPAEASGSGGSLRALLLHANELTSTIPASLGRLTSLTHLYLAYNRLTGTVPFAALSGDGDHPWGLRDLWLEANFLTGTWDFSPDGSPKLELISLGENLLSGSIPRSVPNLRNLTFLDVSANALTGALPPWIGELLHLESFSAHLNALRGTLPEGLTTLTRLRLLSLSKNALTGTIPPSTGNLTSLKTLFLARNELRGTLPETAGDLAVLERLGLSGNRLGGRVPRSLGRLKFLEILDLSNNSFTGDLGFVCGAEGLYALADCHGDAPEVTCRCCAECCRDDGLGPTALGCFPPP